MEQHYSSIFVVVMGMGVTFVGLIAIIFLTQLLGFVMARLDRRRPKPAASASTASAPAAVSAPLISDDGVSDYVKIAILAALAQEPGFRMDRVTSIRIQRA